MPAFEARAEPREGYLYSEWRGEVSMPVVQAKARETLDEAIRHGRAAMLVDCTGVSGDWNRVHRLAFGVFLSEQQHRVTEFFSEPTRIAILVAPGFFDPARYTETAANSRGGRVRSSTDLQELLAWLDVA